MKASSRQSGVPIPAGTVCSSSRKICLHSDQWHGALCMTVEISHYLQQQQADFVCLLKNGMARSVCRTSWLRDHASR